MSAAKLETWASLLRPLGIHWMRPGGGGVGRRAARRRRDGPPRLQSRTSQRYFDVHHSALDVLSAVHPRELELGAIVLAVTPIVLAQEGI